MNARLALLFLILGTPSLAAGDNWPGWRGPTGLGTTDQKALPLTWGGPTNANVLWKSPLPGTDTKSDFDHNQSSAIVWKDRVFVIMVFWPARAPRHRVSRTPRRMLLREGWYAPLGHESPARPLAS